MDSNMKSVADSYLYEFSTEREGDRKTRYIDINLLGPDIQEDPCLDEKLTRYTTFHGYKIHKTYDGEQIKEGLRVVRQHSWKQVDDNKISDDLEMGTIVKVTDNGQVHVQWDTDGTDDFEKGMNNKYELLLFDNAQIGVKHIYFKCNECNQYPLRGIRWTCLTCTDTHLCTNCYMTSKHDLSHLFQRILSSNSKCVQMQPRANLDVTHAVGFHMNSVVKLRSNPEQKGRVHKFLEKKIETFRSDAKVEWNDHSKGRYSVSRNGQCDLKFTNPAKGHKYYEDQLPIVNCQNVEKGVRVVRGPGWDNTNVDDGGPGYIGTVTHIENNTRNDDTSSRDESIKTKRISEKRKSKVVTNREPRNVTVQWDNGKNRTYDLSDQNLRLFDNGPSGIEHPDYFCQSCPAGKTNIRGIRWKCTECEYCDLCTNCYMTGKHDLNHKFQRIVTIDESEQIGVSREDSKSHVRQSYGIFEGATVEEINQSIEKKEGYVRKICDCLIDTSGGDVEVVWKDGRTTSHRIIDLKYDNGDAICYYHDHLPVLGKVSMEEESIKKGKYGPYTDVYPNALSMYLLKEGKWRIPKEHIKTSFSYRSIEYIYEEDMTFEIKKGLWSKLTSITHMAYTTPDYQEEDSEDENACKIIQKCSKEEKATRKNSMISLLDMTTQQIKGRRIKLNVSISELYGLIFFALLQKQYWDGARQLIETGFVRIHHILIGCVIIEDVADNWKITPALNEGLQRLKNAFTVRAIRITRCIFDADKMREDVDKEKKKNYKDDSEMQEERELGDPVNHAGRLLLNHGYIENAIMTKNKTFLDNSTVKGILNKMWYGTEQIDFRTIVCFICLAAVHVVLLPLLTINMEYRPLIWFYKQYKLPFMKVFLNMLGFLALLTAYAYMLLFDYSDDGITRTDYFILAWMISFFVDENKQHIVAIVRGKWKSYVNDWWNRLDWLSMMVYTTGMTLKLAERSQFRTASTVLLVTAFILLCIRILNLCCISSILGPKLVMIRKMFEDTAAFLIIMTVIMMCYNVSFYALLYPNSEFSWQQLEKITRNGYWMLFGELNLDADTLTEPECTFNKTLYGSDVLQRCPTTIGLHLTPYLKAVYGLIAVILLLNLLIAMYSHTFGKVQQESELYWSELQTEFLKNYSIKTVFPIHLQLFVIPATISHAIIWACRNLKKKCCGVDRNDGSPLHHKDELGEDAILDHHPMFVRVFLYNTNFDLKLKTTKEAEGSGALKAKGEIDCIEDDRISMIHRQLDINIKAQEKKNPKMQRNKLLDSNIKTQAIEIQKITDQLVSIEHNLQRLNFCITDLRSKMLIASKQVPKEVTDKDPEKDDEYIDLDDVSIQESLCSFDIMMDRLTEEETEDISNIKLPTDALTSSDDQFSDSTSMIDMLTLYELPTT